MKPIIMTKFICSNCGRNHETMIGASLCCTEEDNKQEEIVNDNTQDQSSRMIYEIAKKLEPTNRSNLFSYAQYLEGLNNHQKIALGNNK